MSALITTMGSLWERKTLFQDIPSVSFAALPLFFTRMALIDANCGVITLLLGDGGAATAARWRLRVCPNEISIEGHAQLQTNRTKRSQQFAVVQPGRELCAWVWMKRTLRFRVSPQPARDTQNRHRPGRPKGQTNAQNILGVVINDCFVHFSTPLHILPPMVCCGRHRHSSAARQCWWYRYSSRRRNVVYPRGESFVLVCHSPFVPSRCFDELDARRLNWLAGDM